jgi:hypothetical protein
MEKQTAIPSSRASLPEFPFCERPGHRLPKFPNIVRKLIGCIEKDLVSEVEKYLQAEFR